MKLLIDTNIILDFLQKREPYYEDASAIFQLSVDNEVIECVTASSITDIYYLINKEFKDVKKTKERIQDLLELITILDVTNKDIQDAIRSEWKDFEDSLQYIVALHNSVDAIISRNTKDFFESSIPIYSPKEFLNFIK